jgi:dipeptidyl aminopeptidase/acylaminoacyl peptidase
VVGSTGRAFEPRDLTRIKHVSDPQISPDGRRVAFVVTTLSEEKDDYFSTIWLVDVAGGEPRPFTNGPKRDTSPRWSSDGSRLAFVSDREPKKKSQIYVMPVDGGEPVRVTDAKNGAANPVWSPDGTKIAFVARVGGWQEPESEEERQKSKPIRTITTLKHKYNGEGFVYDRRPHLFVVDATGGEARQLTDGDFADVDPVWSADGQWIAFVSARHDDRDYDNASDVWLVSPDGGEPRRLTSTTAPVEKPIFSPDGQTIAYLGDRALNEAGRNTRIYTIPVGGGSPTCLTEALDRDCVWAEWIDGGAALAFGVQEHGNVPVLRVATSGGRNPERILGGDRQIGELSASADGRILAFVATEPTSPSDLFVCNADGSGERQLTDLNRAWKSEVALGRPERFHFQRAGFELDGWVVRPFGFEAGKRYPVLLNIHGGPMTQYGHNFFDEFQVYAGAGYAVVYTNPRGSQGYGEEFTRAVVGDWGGGDYADVMAGLDEALRRYALLDPERLGVMGGSYGGYLTSWIVGHTQRFKAACSERALNTFPSFFGTSDIGSFFPEWHSGALPWDNPRWYVEHSPLTYSQQITTPLLIIHSEQDLRCPIEQGEQLFVALKRQRKDVTFVRVPDENHELSRSGKPRHRIERFQIILDWFKAKLTQ